MIIQRLGLADLRIRARNLGDKELGVGYAPFKQLIASKFLNLRVFDRGQRIQAGDWPLGCLTGILMQLSDGREALDARHLLGELRCQADERVQQDLDLVAILLTAKLGVDEPALGRPHRPT
jgi:hypothetical protein